MHFIRIKPADEKKVVKFATSFPAKILAGVVIFGLILVVFVFAGSRNFFFEKSGFERTSGRTNILLLGTGGDGHQGGELSDTVILASINLKDRDVALVSIPRDLWVPDLNAKINTAYEKGEENNKKQGLEFAKKIVEKVTGIPIHYAVRVDFAGFVRAIDLLGGIDVNVERGFDDFNYPLAGKEDDTCGYKISEVEVNGAKQLQILDTTGSAVLAADPFTCRYEHISFKSGLQHMDGQAALKFVRSRMGTNGAGSDFDRSARQKQVILASVKKVFDLKNLFSPKKTGDIITNLDKDVDTDFTTKEFSQIPSLLSQLPAFNFRSLALTSQGDFPLLYNPPVSEFAGVWVLLPKDNSWEKLSGDVKNFVYQIADDQRRN